MTLAHPASWKTLRRGALLARPLLLLALPVGIGLAWRIAPVSPAGLLEHLHEAGGAWLALALAMQALHFLGYAALFRGCLQIAGVRGPATGLGFLLPRALAWTAADRIAPFGGLGGAAAFTTLLAGEPEPVRVPPSRSLPALGLAYLLDYTVFALLVVLTLVYPAFDHHTVRGAFRAAGLLLTIAVGGTLLSVLIYRRYRGVPDSLREMASVVRTRPGVLLGPITGCLLREVGDALTLYAACRAVGLPIHPAFALVIYIISGALGLVSFVPQGLGVVEASTVLLLHGYGYSPGPALTATLLYRGVSFWLPILPGLVSMLKLRSSRQRGVSHSIPSHRECAVTLEHRLGEGRMAVRIAAVLTALLGLLNIISALMVQLPWRRQILADLLPIHAIHAGRTLVVFTGFMLLYLAGQLWRRKRRAWQLAISTLMVSLVLHLVKGLDFEEAAFCLVGIILLWMNRTYFLAGHDPASIRSSLWIVVFSAAAVALYGLLGFALLQPQFGGRLAGSGDFIRAAWTWFFTLDDHDVFPRTARAWWFVRSLDALGMAALTTALLALGRPLARDNSSSESERAEVEDLLRQHGRTSIAHFCLLPDKNYFWNPEHTGVIAYKLVGNVALALGDPIASEEDIAALTSAYIEMCILNDWRPAFYQVTPSFARTTRLQGLTLLKVGEDAVINLDTFSLTGRGAKELRGTINAMERQGIVAEWYDLQHDPRGISDDLRHISDTWLRSKRGSEKTFSLGYFDLERMRPHPLIVAFDPEGQPIAFENLVPMYACSGYAGDLNRRLPQAPRRIQEYLIVRCAQALKERGHLWYGQGLAPLATMGDPSPGVPSTSGKAVSLLFNHFNAFYGFRGLRAFKQKFNPEWESRYLAYPGAVLLPKVVTAIIRADSRKSLLYYLRPLRRL